jgi:hypothetical protein
MLPAAPFPLPTDAFSAEVGHGGGPAGVGDEVGVAGALLAGWVAGTVTVLVGAAAAPGLLEEPHAAISRAAPPSAAAAIMRRRSRWNDVIAVPLIVADGLPEAM